VVVVRGLPELAGAVQLFIVFHDQFDDNYVLRRSRFPATILRMSTPTVRRELRPGDYGAIVEHHGRVYAREYGMDSSFEADVAAAVTRAALRGFPRDTEAIWIVERGGVHAGSLALTDEGDGLGCIRFVVLDADLRGGGLGRRLLGELLETARAIGFDRLSLKTFSDLQAAAHLYRSHGFRVVDADIGPRWGRAELTYQTYELALPGGPQAETASSKRATKPIV
jgi:N-acetylglutamate synthase-like GNAT family acetyltransferase